MRRKLYILTTILFIFTLAGVNLRPNASLATQRESTSPPLAREVGQTITIFFHGLMVARYNKDELRFEVGIVKNADGHEFELSRWEGSGDPIPITIPEKKEYEFDVVYDDNSATDGVLERYTPQGTSFNRMTASDEVKKQDYRYAADIEGPGLHNEKKSRRSKPFKFAFHVLKGTLKSKCLTDDIIEKKKRTESSYTDYGYIAEIIGVDITLLPGQKLVLRRKGQTTSEWSYSYSAGGTLEVRVLHLPSERLLRVAQENSKNRSDYITEACKPFPEDPQTSHFELYYIRAIDVRESDRFDLRSSGRGRKLAVPMTIYPYKCGLILQSKTDDEIDNDDMN